MKISHQKLLDKLLQIDERLVNIWLQDDTELGGLGDDEIWDLFVVLLETRVELLRTCKDAGLVLTREMVLPEWLERLVTSRNEIRLREIKQLARDLKHRRMVLGYQPGGKREGNLDESV